MPGVFRTQFQDYSYEKASMQIPIPTVTPGNWVSVVDTLIPALELEIPNLMIGDAIRRQIIGRRTKGVGAAPTSLAQRELKWLVTYESDEAYRKFTIELPTADGSQVITGTDYLDLTAGVGLAFKTAFEAVAIAPDDGAVTVLSVRLVGRNI